jgi:hypothetical protein
VTTLVAEPLLASRLPAPTLVAYGVFGMPLAMAALPLYVHLPKFYGDHLGFAARHRRGTAVVPALGVRGEAWR